MKTYTFEYDHRQVIRGKYLTVGEKHGIKVAIGCMILEKIRRQKIKTIPELDWTFLKVSGQSITALKECYKET